MARIHNRSARSQSTPLLRLYCALSLTAGCATPWLDSYDHEETIACRVDNPDRDNLWDTSDTNGNGIIDDNETIGPVFDMAALRSGSGVNTSSSTLGSDVRISSPGFPETFNAGRVLIVTVPEYLTGIGDSRPSSVEASGVTSVVGSSFTVLPDDLNEFNLSFDNFRVRPHTETYGMQIVRSHSYRKSSGSEESIRELSYLQLSYGARYHRLREAFALDARGSVLGSINTTNVYDNEILGPQIALELGKKLSIVDLQLGGSIMSGFNLASGNQHDSLGPDRLPGGLNQAVNSRPRVSVVEQESSEFASLAEIRAQLTMPMSDCSTFRFGYTTLYFSHLRHVDTAIDWSLPDFGFTSIVTNDTWVSGLHASIEWRR